MRILGAARLSHDTDASTSIERQVEQIEHAVAARGDVLVGIAEDVDTSGVVPPALRPGLGRWLSGPALNTWDGLLVVKLDRLTRSVRQFDDLRIFCDANDKVIISIAESLDLSTSVGRMFAGLLAMFAQFERERMSERREDASRKLYGRGGYNGGGSLPWGYRAERINGQIGLLVDTDLAVMINTIADSVIKGASVVEQAYEHGLDPASLLRRLRKVSLKGWVTYHGEVIRGDDGLPLTRPPVISARKWDRLQARLNANAPGRSVPRTAYPWLHVLACYECGEDLYIQKIKGTSRSYLYHKRTLLKYKETGNARPCTISIPGRVVHAILPEHVLRAMGDLRVPEVVNTPAEDYDDAINEVEQAIGDLESDRYERHLFKGEAGTQRYTAMMLRLEARAEELRALPKLPARREVILSTETFQQRWESAADDHARGDMLRRAGIKVFVRKGDRGGVRLYLRQAGTRWGAGPRREG